MNITKFVGLFAFLILFFSVTFHTLEQEDNQTLQEAPQDVIEGEEKLMNTNPKKQSQQKTKSFKKNKKKKGLSSKAKSNIVFQREVIRTISSTITYLYENFQMLCIRVFPKIALQVLKVARLVYKIVTEIPIQKSKKVFYPDNFANLHGGAKIIMKSSPKIKYVNSILEDSIDKYLYTNQELPFKIIIGLNEQIAIESIIIRSFEMYSSITQDFVVLGSFSLHHPKWVHLGSFKAANNFNQQEFFTERKIVRYIKMKFLTAYGKWSYFTLTQIKIRGKGLFADALTELTEKKLNSQSDHEQDEPTIEFDKKGNICPNEFRAESKLSDLPHEGNVISSLIKKIDNLENKNQIQGKTIKTLEDKLEQAINSLEESKNNTIKEMKKRQTLQRLEKQNKKQNSAFDWNLQMIVTVFSLCISLVTLLSLLCLCCLRRKELSTMRGSFRGSGEFKVKKSNSNK